MTRPLAEALVCRPVPTRPVWVMRQAGRYLPEYRRIREKVSFQEAVSTPEIAAELTLQPIRRFGLDGAVIFADIMTPLEAMGVEMTFAPGPKLRPHSITEVIALGDLVPDRVAFVAETIRLVRKEVPDQVSVVGFAGAPVTLLAYLVEGGGSSDFARFRASLREDPPACVEALSVLGRAMAAYLEMQVKAGVDALQLFDSWAGLLDVDQFRELAVPAARAAIAALEVPSIYFAPGAGHTLGLQAMVESDAIGVDWRLPIDRAWELIGDRAIQGNLDPALLLTDERTIRRSVRDLLDLTAGRPGHIVNLGHGIWKGTPPGNVAILVDEVRK